MSSPTLPTAGSVDVLFVAYGGGHISMVLPVAHALAERGVRVCIFALTTAIAQTRASGLPWFSYDALPQAHNAQAQAYGAELAAGMAPNPTVPTAETQAYLGCNMADLAAQYGPQKATALYQETGRGQFFPVATMTALFKDIRPRIVVATNSPRSEKAAITAAGDLGIPSLCLVDMFALQTVDWLKASDYATRVCVLNDRVRDLFIRKGRPAEHVVVTGNPAFDKLRDPKIQAAGHALRGARGWSRKDCVLLYASSPETPTHATTGALSDLLLPRKVEDALRDIVSRDTALTLVIRRHPSENQDVELGPRIFQSTMADAIDPLLHAVDVVVVTASTVGFQGHLAGRPVVSVECSAVSPNVPYGAFGIARAVDDIADIGLALAACVADAKSTATGADRNQVFAADLVVAQILPLLEEVA